MNSTATRATRAWHMIREAILTLLALGGAACIVLTIMAFTGGYSLIMFKTGSMSPTIPAGSVALVQQVPATDLAVGDIVTVDRENALPVTHRITSIADGDTADERIITMRGDANEAEDPFPYAVTEVKSVVGSVPRLAYVIVWFGNPWVLGVITLGAAALVTWAFWPREPRSTRNADAAPENPPETRRGRRAAGLIAVAAVVLSGAVPWDPAPAYASEDLLVMTSDLPASAEHALDAVNPLLWHIDVNASAAPGDGDLSIDLSARDDDLALTVEVRACGAAWTAGSCAIDERVLTPADSLAAEGAWSRLLETPTPSRVHLQIALTAPVPPTDPRASASITVRAVAGQTVASETINGADALATTGGRSWAYLAAPAAIFVGIGIALIVAARRRRRNR